MSGEGIVGRDYGNNLEVLMRIREQPDKGYVRVLPEEEILDAALRDCDDSGLLVSRGSLARLASERRPLQAAGTATQVAVGQGEQGLAPLGSQEQASALELGRLAAEGEERQWLTMTASVFSCLFDSTGAYACEPGVEAGACPGYVLNPGSEGPGVTGPSLYVAAGPSWPCGTRFRLATGQEVIVADRGGMVHDRHLDFYCFDATKREMCLPGIGASVEVMVMP